MSVNINIGGTIISFPTSGANPDWASAVDQFAQAVEQALNSVVGPYDIVPQQFSLTSVPNNTTTSIPNLIFSPAVVRGAFVTYTVFRTTDSVTVSESGNLLLVYNESNTVGNKWEMARDAVSDSQVIFSITDTGQIQINTAILSGSNYSGYVSFSGRALQDSY